MYYGFQGSFPNMLLNSRGDGFGPYQIQYCLPNNTILLIIIDKFDPNPMLVNINKLKHIGSLKAKPCNLYWLNLVT